MLAVKRGWRLPEMHLSSIKMREDSHNKSSVSVAQSVTAPGIR